MVLCVLTLLYTNIMYTAHISFFFFFFNLFDRPSVFKVKFQRTMEKDGGQIAELRLRAEQGLQDKETVDKFFDLGKKIIKIGGTSEETRNEIEGIQKGFILGSFKINSFHKAYKDWENNEKDLFRNQEVREYNKKQGQMARLNVEIEKLQEEYDQLKNKVKIPSCQLSIETLKLYDNGLFLKYVQNADGGYPRTVNITQLFSIETDSELPRADFKVLQEMLNIENGLCLQRRIKYEVLLGVKQQLTARNRKWSIRDNDLHTFMSEKLRQVFSDVDKVRQSEYEYFKDYIENYNEEEEEGVEEYTENEDQEVEEAPAAFGEGEESLSQPEKSLYYGSESLEADKDENMDLDDAVKDNINDDDLDNNNDNVDVEGKDSVERETPEIQDAEETTRSPTGDEDMKVDS